MKYVFVFLAIYLLATTFAAQSKNKMAASEAATREAAASLKRLSSTKLGKTLLDTIQIELKSNTGVDPRPRIFQLLQEILDETNDQINTLNDNIATVRQGCEDTQNQLNTDIADLNNQIDAATQEQAAVQADLASLTDQHDAAVALGESYQSQLDALNNIRAEHKAAYDAENARLLKIRSVLEQTNGFIQDRIQQRDNPSFLQRNNILMEIKRKVMSPEFQSAASGWGKFINFLATKALAKIKQTPDDQAQEGLARIVIVINDLIESVNLDINFRNAAEQTEIAIYEPARDNLEDVLSTTNAQIASLELNIGLDNDRLTVLAASLQNNGEILEKKQQELADEESYCQQQEDEYSQVFAQRNNEVEIINEVIDIIKNQLTNLHAAVESVINSSESSDSEDQ